MAPSDGGGNPKSVIGRPAADWSPTTVSCDWLASKGSTARRWSRCDLWASWQWKERRRWQHMHWVQESNNTYRRESFYDYIDKAEHLIWRKERGFFSTYYTYITVFIRNAANFTLLLLKGSKLRKGNKN
jgi:hypothetical protein